MRGTSCYMSYAPTLTLPQVKVTERQLGMGDAIDMIREQAFKTKDKNEQALLLAMARRIQDKMERSG